MVQGGLFRDPRSQSSPREDWMMPSPQDGEGREEVEVVEEVEETEDCDDEDDKELEEEDEEGGSTQVKQGDDWVRVQERFWELQKVVPPLMHSLPVQAACDEETEAAVPGCE